MMSLDSAEPLFKWASNFLLLATGISALLTKSYTEDEVSGKRKLTLLGRVQVCGFVVGFALFAISQQTENDRRAKEAIRNATLQRDLVDAKQSASVAEEKSRTAVEQLKTVLTAEEDLGNRAKIQALIAQKQVEFAQRQLLLSGQQLVVANKTLDQQVDLGKGQRDLSVQTDAMVKTEGQIQDIQGSIRTAQGDIAARQNGQIEDLKG